jgi:ABC-type sugar transport system ATPase subunit
MAAISILGVSKRFTNGSAAVRDLTLDIADGELVVLVGPSGSGKSTTLRLIAGLESPTGGRILIGGRDVTRLPPQSRDLAMVFQGYALYPHKTVRENLAFGLRMRGIDRQTIAERVERAAGSLQIETLLDRRPAQLSGGQRQRVALGRAIVREPLAFLLDEPMSNLDPALRLDTRAELSTLHRRLQSTMVYVTHDQEEAMTLGNRIVVMREGRVEQVGAPLEVYRQPTNVFVARFIGSPAMNLLPATLEASGSDAVISVSGLTMRLEAAGPLRRGEPLLLGIRPHDVELGGAGGDATAGVDMVEPLGSALRLHLVPETGEPWRIVAVVPADAGVTMGDRVSIHLRRDRLHLFRAETGERVATGWDSPCTRAT